jgi:ZIP family zinc transporter/zinc and cadmium transporter
MMAGLLYSVLAALGDIAGGLLVVGGSGRGRAALRGLVGFGAGFMLAVALIEMAPRAMEVPYGLVAVLFGYLGVHLTQHTLTPHFHFGEETHADAMVSRGIGVYALVGLIPHSFFDGVAITSGFLRSSELGLLIFAAIVLHKVPTGISLASIMLASGNSRGRATAAVLLTALATVLGGLLTPALAPLAHYGLALAAGVTIYVAASNLIPESQHQPGWLVQGGVFVGVVAFFLVRLILPDIGP